MCTGTFDYKKWIKTSLCALVVILLFIGILNVIVDPYFHFHKPITKYRLMEERYINDGIARHFEYDAIITGNSLTENFKTSQYDELFNTNSIKLPYSGAGYRELWGALGRNLSYNDNVKQVFVGMDLDDLDRHSGWQRYLVYPEYMYDDNLINDVNYILNKEVLYRGTLFNLLWTMSGNDSTSFDEYAAWDRESGYSNACADLDIIVDKYEENKQNPSDYDMNKMDSNVRETIIPVLEANPNVEFTFVIPPSSVAKWAEYYNKGHVEYMIAALEHTLQLLLSYNNVEIYGFDDAFDVSENLNLYSDTIHYNSSINEWMLDEIKAGNHQIDSDNYMEYIEALERFYGEYDYQVLNEYIK